jgi:hypothetical protein
MDPFNATGPISGEIEQEEARVLFQVRVLLSPTFMIEGSALRVAVGAIWYKVTL